MAINFEAANMAGYNNPKIEVFKAIINFETNAIIEAPSKSKIKSCLKRGAIPSLMCASPDGSEGNLLWVRTWASSSDGDTILFGSTGLIIMYTPDSELPVFSTGG